MTLPGLSHENTWIGLNDRTVEEDFQWTDNLELVRLCLLTAICMKLYNTFCMKVVNVVSDIAKYQLHFFSDMRREICSVFHLILKKSST